jgi:uncharacterized spore protein YtfJ
MSLTEFTCATAHTPQEASALLSRIIDLASAEAVYGQPLDGEGFRVFTAVEVVGGMGFGFAACGDAAQGEGEQADDDRPSLGVGGGGGAISAARPVAVISLTPAGVRIEPIIDGARVLVTFGIALGAGLLALARRR